MARSCTFRSHYPPPRRVPLIFPALLIASILIGLVVAGGSQTSPAIAAAGHVWAQRAPVAAAGVAPAAHVAGCPATPDFSFSVPDPADDSFGAGLKHEITDVSVEGDATTFCLTVDFADPVDPADAATGQELVGFVDFDTDADAATGFPSNADFFCPSHAGIGSEAFLDMFSVSGGTGSIFDYNTLTTTPVPVTFDTTSFTAVIPLSAIGGDNSLNFTMVLGTLAEPTDCAPDGASIHSPDGSIVLFVPLEVSLVIDQTGTVVPKTGAASLSGTVDCSKPSSVGLNGSLRQRSGRGSITGFFSSTLQCDGTTVWRAMVTSDSGPFAGGPADVSVNAFAFTFDEFASADASATVRLQGTRTTSGVCPRTGNDGFEAGAVDSNVIPCWTVTDLGSGSWCNQSGTVPPQGPCSGSVAAVAVPPEGLQAAMTNQSGPGSHLLYRCGVLRSGSISFQLYLNNLAGIFTSPPTLDPNAFPNQQFRADLVAAAAASADPFTVAPGDVLLNLYQTQPGDPPVSGYLQVSDDASSLVGQEVCLRFAEVDDLGNFDAGVDDVRIDLRTVRTH